MKATKILLLILGIVLFSTTVLADSWIPTSSYFENFESNSVANWTTWGGGNQPTILTSGAINGTYSLNTTNNAWTKYIYYNKFNSSWNGTLNTMVVVDAWVNGFTTNYADFGLINRDTWSMISVDLAFDSNRPRLQVIEDINTSTFIRYSSLGYVGVLFYNSSCPTTSSNTKWRVKINLSNTAGSYFKVIADIFNSSNVLVCTITGNNTYRAGQNSSGWAMFYSTGSGSAQNIYGDDASMTDYYYSAASSTINLTAGLPLSNSQTPNTNTNFNTTGNLSYANTNCSLNINGIRNQSVLYGAGTNVLINFSQNFASTDALYSWSINCSDNFTNATTGNNNLYINPLYPNITTSLDANDTYATVDFAFAVTAEDPFLKTFAFNKTVGFNSTCVAVNYSNTSVTSPFTRPFNFGVQDCSLGNQSLTFQACDAPNGTTMLCTNTTVLWQNRALINVSAHDEITGAGLANFSIYLNGTFLGNTTTGIYSITNLTIGSWNVTINPDRYEIKSVIFNITTAVANYYNFSVYTQNSINIRIYDETTSALINSTNVSIKFSTNDTEFTNTTATGLFYIDNLPIREYSLLFTAPGYTGRTYTITVGNKTSQNLNAYLPVNASTTIFTISDSDTTEILPNVLVTMYKMVNSSWSVIESKYSDVSGKVQFSYIQATNYKFYLNKAAYTDYIFYLNPILFSTYDVQMTKSTTINYSQDFDDLALIYSPTSFNNLASNTFNMVLSSPLGSLVYYGMDLAYPGGTSSAYGTNAIGGQLTATFTPNATSVYDTVNVSYYYYTTISGRRNFTMLLPIMSSDNSNFNGTFMSNKDRTFGLGIFERIFIATLIILAVVGIAVMLGQTVPGLALGLVLFGYLAYIGFIPLWAILPSMFVGVLFLIWKSGGY